MLRWLGLVVTICLFGSSADAQVFKPKAKKAATTQKSDSDSAPAKKSAKKQPRKAATKKRVTSKKKSKAQSDDETATAEPKGGDKDYVKIWDDDEIE